MSQPTTASSKTNATATPNVLSCDAASARTNVTSRQPASVIRSRFGRGVCATIRARDVRASEEEVIVIASGERALPSLSMEFMRGSLDPPWGHRIGYRTVRVGSRVGV